MSLREIARLPSNAVELNGEQSRQVLEQTRRPGVPIRMVGASDEAPVTARVRTVTNGTIELQVEWTTDRTCPITPGACCVCGTGRHFLPHRRLPTPVRFLSNPAKSALSFARK